MDKMFTDYIVSHTGSRNKLQQSFVDQVCIDDMGRVDNDHRFALFPIKMETSLSRVMSIYP